MGEFHSGQFAIARILAIAGAVLLPIAAPAQDARAVEEMFVTGSRIPQTNMVSSSPITTISSEDVQLEGANDAQRLLQDLPQVFQSSTRDFSSVTNPLTRAGGISTVNLRGLGPTRTLVLVDGRRLGPADANTGNLNPAPDLNQIPTQLIERVDVVTGGESAIYGSDAIAGVVNFIMKKDFEGIEIDGQYGLARHENHSSLMQSLLDDAGFEQPAHTVTDGNNQALSLLMGANVDGGRGNVTAYFTYRKDKPVLQGHRDFSACKLAVNLGNTDPSDPPAGPTTPFCSGSPNSNQFINALDDTRDFQVSGNQFVPWGTADTSPPARFNSNPDQTLFRPDSRYTAGVLAQEEVNDKIEAYFEFAYMDDQSSAVMAPSGAFEGGNPYDAQFGGAILVNCDNPLLSAQQSAAIGCNDPGLTDGLNNVPLLIGRRNIEGAGGTSTYEHQNFRYTMGMDGDLGQGWKYDAYFQYYYTTVLQSNKNYLSNRAINNALQVVDVGGVPTCKSRVDGSDPACVPWNIFTQGAVTPDQVDYLNSLGTQYGTIAEKTISGQATNDLARYGLQLPWATDGVGIALGAEYRYDTIDFQPDVATESGDLSGFGGAGTAISDSIYVMEEFVELRVPIIQGKPGAEELLFSTAYRNSDYNLAGRVGTFKFQLRYQPVEDIRFRTGWSRAMRAPNMIELFNPQSVTNTGEVNVDPCAGSLASPATATLEECLHTGVTAAQYGDGAATNSIIQCPAGQCAVLQGGNPQLEPETADTFTLGATFTPTVLENFSASVDYYKIKVSDILGPIPISISLANCLATGDSTFCNNIVRTPTGNLFGTTVDGGGYLKGTNVNVAEQTVSGVDLQLNYSYALPNSWGDLSTALLGTWQDTNVTRNITGSPSYDCSGLYGATCDTVNPDWRSTLRLNWTTPWDVLLSVQWRYIGGVALDTNSTYSQLSNGRVDSFNGTLPSVSYFDLSLIWNAPYGINVRAGVDNVFDKDPPLVSAKIAGNGSPNTYPSYDLVGQVFFVGFTAKL